MKLSKQFYLFFGLTPLFANAIINFDIAIVRNRAISISDTVSLHPAERGKKVLEDSNTYIEVELVTEKADEAVVQCMVATKDEKNMFIVRGMPRLTVPLKNGLGMASLNCDGDAEHFMIVVAASKK